VDWWLKLPAIPARLVTAIGIRDDAKSKGVGFAIEVNGRKVFDKTLQPASGWVAVEVSLAEWRNQPVVLTLLTDSLDSSQFAWAVWAEPRLAPERRGGAGGAERRDCCNKTTRNWLCLYRA
jgi:hypothetical protein